MKKFIFLLLILLGSSVLHAKVKVTAFKAPNASQQVYQSMLVSAGLLPYDQKKKMEDNFISQLKKISSTKFIAEYEILPPMRRYETEEYLRILQQHNIQSVWQISYTDGRSEARTHYENQTEYSSGYVGLTPYTIQTNSQVPVTEVVDYYTYKLDVYDVARNELMWSAEVQTSQTRGAKISEKWTASSFVSKSVKELGKSGLLLKK